MYKVGDKIKIKSYKEIHSLLEFDSDGDGFTNTIHFNEERMKNACGKTLTIIKIRPSPDDPNIILYVAPVNGDEWCWIKEWIEPFIEPVKLPEDLFIL